MRNRYSWLLCLAFLAACHGPRPKGNISQPLTAEEFEKIFVPLSLPYTYSSDSLAMPAADSLAFKVADLMRFIPDSLLHQAFRKGEKVKYFPIGSIRQDDRQWLLIKAVSTRTSAAYLCIWSRKEQYINGFTIGKTGGENSHLQWTARMEKNNQLTLRRSEEVTPTHLVTSEDVYAIQPDGSKTLVLTNSSEPVSPDQIANPIDTFPRKSKYAADYVSGKMNIVSIRDGSEAKTFRFFIYFTRDNGNCSGELDGTGKFVKPNVGEYHEKGGLCGIRFTFSASQVTIKEIGGCGAYRGISCFFDGTFTKKKKTVKDKKPGA